MFFGEDEPDEFGMKRLDHIHELAVLAVVILMLVGIYAKIVFL